jgi:nicotinamide-nucleotide amidase
MIAEILATGDEIRSGSLVDTNSAFIAEALERAGVPVGRHSCVGDQFDVLVSVLKEIGERADIGIVTGGLGPTTDDLSAEAAAAAAGVDLVLDHRALEEIEIFFKKRQRPMTESNRKQAMLPRGAETLYNPLGTAPGFHLKIRKCDFFFLPGVPPEMRPMLTNDVLPKIEKILGVSRRHCIIKTITTFGLTESAAGEKVADLPSRFPGIKLGLRAKFPEIHIKLYLDGENEIQLIEIIEEAEKWIADRIGRYVLSLNGESMQKVVGRLLKKRSATLAVAESCTGGRIANWLTDVSGSSDYFQFSGVTYSNEAKVKVLGVSPETLEQYGAVHEETVKEMAVGARRLSGADYAIATSGIAGPTGGTEDKPVGTVCIGLATPDTVVGQRFYFPFGRRGLNKSIFAMTALDVLRRELLAGSES